MFKLLFALLSLLSLLNFTVDDSDEEEDDDDETPETDPAKARESLQARLRKFKNDAMALAADQHTELYKLRAKLRRARQQAQAAAPAEGSVVLTKDEVQVWNTLRAYSPEEIQTMRQENESLKAEKAAEQKKAQLAKVASALGYEPVVFQQLPGIDGVVFELTEVEGEDPKVQSHRGEGEKKDGRQFVESEWQVFLPALQTTNAQTSRQTGRDWVRQGSESQTRNEPSGTSPVAIAGKIMSSKYKLPGSRGKEQ